MVISAIDQGSHVTQFEFSGPVTWDGVTVDVGISQDGDASIATSQISPTIIQLEFTIGGSGSTWGIGGPTTGLNPAPEPGESGNVS